MKFRLCIIVLVCLVCAFNASAQDCVQCHEKITPNIVSDWKLSKHSTNDTEMVGCDICHGDQHISAEDVANVNLPTPEVCANCHADQVDEFTKGKHAAAWAAMNAMPTTHGLPVALTEGMKGCGGCHKIGLKT